MDTIIYFANRREKDSNSVVDLHRLTQYPPVVLSTFVYPGSHIHLNEEAIVPFVVGSQVPWPQIPGTKHAATKMPCQLKPIEIT